ncbi:hypothetical protein [Xenorhabdus eapokensis]|nr:hypothetical protein [Xenorhabdus eapokensis]
MFRLALSVRGENKNATIPCTLGTRWERVAAWVISVTTQGNG